MSILPLPVTMPQSKSRMDMACIFGSARNHQSQPTSSLPELASSPQPDCVDSESQEVGCFSSSAHRAPTPSRDLVTPTIVVSEDVTNIFMPHGATLSVPVAAHLQDAKLTAKADDSAVVELSQRVEQLVSLVVKMEQERTAREDIEHSLRREILTLHGEKEDLQMQVASLKEVLRTSMRRLNDCVDASAIAMDTERELRHEIEAKARRAEDRMKSLVEENDHLLQAKAAVENELSIVSADAKVWRSKIRATQNMQEVAMVTYHRCETLEKENSELRQVMHVFAKGSTSMIVQQLQIVIERLANELRDVKKRGASLLAEVKEDHIGENALVLDEMRTKTNALQVCSAEVIPHFLHI